MTIKLPVRYVYYKTFAKNKEYNGIKYFRLEVYSNKCTQVTVYPGEYKRGRGNIFGITLISHITLFSNFIGPKYVEACTEKEFNKNFNEVVKFLK